MKGKEMRMILKAEKEMEERKEVAEEKEKKKDKEKKSKSKKLRTNPLVAFLRRAKVPEEKQEKKDAKEKKSKIKKLKDNKFVAFLQRAWRALTGRFRGKTSRPERRSDELPGPSSGSNNLHSKDNAPSTEPDTEDQERNRTSDEKLICDNGPPDLEDMLGYYTAKEILGDVSSHSQEKENRAQMSPEAICSQSQIRLGEEPNQSDEEASGTQPLSLDNFTLLKMLGKGAYGSVVLARDNIRKEEVALKVVDKSELLKDDSGLVEHQILQLSHQSPYLIHGPAAFQTLSAIFFVLEYAPRGDLQDFLQKNFPLAKDTVQFIMAELICGVQFLHNIGAIHRDLKLPNILLASDGHIKITDFGVVQMNVYDNIGQWGFAGTPAYLAPEMFLGEAYGRGVDYFAIGVILYKLLQFHPPFTGSSLEEIALSIIYDRPHFPDNMPFYTMDIIERLLCKNQFQRLGVNGNVTEHPYFSNVIWEDVQLKRVKPPAVMTAEEDERTGAASPKADEFEKNKELFQNFSYVGPAWEQQYHPRRLFQERQG